MNMLAQALAASPDLFPAAFDLQSGVVTVWSLSRADYQDSAFLDGRIAAGKPARQIPFALLTEAVEATELTENCHFIFHIGHVGSTLLSRLLGKHPALFSLREPDILRTLSTLPGRAARDGYAAPFLKLFSRTYEPQARALVKTTSFVSAIASDLLARVHDPHALAIGVPPEVYLATIFGGENAPAEARALAPMRSARLRGRLSDELRLDNLREGENVALGWACESLSLADAAQRAGARLLIVNFENFLARPHETLARMFTHFGVPASNPEITAILAGREMRVYSKATEYAYDAEMRRAILGEGRVRHAGAIRQGLQWLERLAAECPAVADALSAFN